MLTLKNSPGPGFIRFYELAVSQKFRPAMSLFKDENLKSWQQMATGYWLRAFSILEAHRTGDPIHGWKEYALPRISKGQLENPRMLRNFAITLRDFGAGHTLRNLKWSLRYPRERLISILPLLLDIESNKPPQNAMTPLAMSTQAERPEVVDRYLETWARYA